jgi:hypothetical protein
LLYVRDSTVVLCRTARAAFVSGGFCSRRSNAPCDSATAKPPRFQMDPSCDEPLTVYGTNRTNQPNGQPTATGTARSVKEEKPLGQNASRHPSASELRSPVFQVLSCSAMRSWTVRETLLANRLLFIASFFKLMCAWNKLLGLRSLPSESRANQRTSRLRMRGAKLEKSNMMMSILGVPDHRPLPREQTRVCSGDSRVIHSTGQPPWNLPFC